MKIIDLLNKIANGKEVPKIIKYGRDVYEFRKDIHQYYKKNTDTYYKNKLKFDGSIEYQFYGDYLNDEVEIIEDTEEIDIQSIEELPKIIHISADDASVRTEFNNIIDNQNIILNAIKQLDNKLKEE